jgi:hypothetical protein
MWQYEELAKKCETTGTLMHCYADMKFPVKLNAYLACDTVIPLLDFYPKEVKP